MQSIIMKLNDDGIKYCQTGQYKCAMVSFNCAVQKLQTLLNTATEKCEQYVPTTLSWENFQPTSQCSSNEYVYKHFANIRSIGDSDEDLSLCSVILMFNLALTSQLFGTVQNKSKVLLNSFKFYRIAARVYPQSPKKKTQAIIFLPMAIMNNMAQLYFEMSDYDNAELCLEKLRSVISNNEEYIDEESFDVPSRKILYENAFVFETPSIAPAA